MNNLAIGLLSALLATNQPQAVSNVIQQETGIAVPLADQRDPAERELRELMMADDAAMDEVDGWIKTNSIPETNVVARTAFNQRIRARLDVVRKGYNDFLQRHPNNAHGYMAYGSFLNEIGEEDAAVVQYENAKQLDPKNPAVWNNLANYYGENGPLTNAFMDYAEAIRLDPSEPVYYENYATTVYLFRKDARAFFDINEQQVFDKALGLYRQAMKLAPKDFVLATDYAESYYGIKPLRTNDALVAWTNALNVARTDGEREGVELHLARVKISAGLYAEAQAHLDAVTNAIYSDLKRRLERSLNDHKNSATNSVSEVSQSDPSVPVHPAPAAAGALPGGATATDSITNLPMAVPAPELKSAP